jgi:hypothetical protein
MGSNTGAKAKADVDQRMDQGETSEVMSLGPSGCKLDMCGVEAFAEEGRKEEYGIQ